MDANTIVEYLLGVWILGAYGAYTNMNKHT